MGKLFPALSALLLSLALVIFFWAEHSWQLCSPKPQKIGCLHFSPVDGTTLRGLKEGMSEIGYREGKEIVYEVRGPVQEIGQLDELAAELVALEPDVIFVSSTPATLAVQRAVKGLPIPVVFDPVNDPVAAGIVDSLAHPGGNFTGIKLASGDSYRLHLLLEIAPQVTKIYLPYNPTDKSALLTMDAIIPFAEKLGVTFYTEEMANPEQVRTAIERFPDQADAIFLPRDSMVESQIELFRVVAEQRKVPISAPSALQVEAGALLSYGHNHFQLGRQAAHLVEQVLGGVDPGDIPVEESRLFFELNLDVATRIGLHVPESILRRADFIHR